MRAWWKKNVCRSWNVDLESSMYLLCYFQGTYTMIMTSRKMRAKWGLGKYYIPVLSQAFVSTPKDTEKQGKVSMKYQNNRYRISICNQGELVSWVIHIYIYIYNFKNMNLASVWMRKNIIIACKCLSWSRCVCLKSPLTPMMSLQYYCFWGLIPPTHYCTSSHGYLCKASW